MGHFATDVTLTLFLRRFAANYLIQLPLAPIEHILHWVFFTHGLCLLVISLPVYIYMIDKVMLLAYFWVD